jgi:hypothetical protein
VGEGKGEVLQFFLMRKTMGVEQVCGMDHCLEKYRCRCSYLKSKIISDTANGGRASSAHQRCQEEFHSASRTNQKNINFEVKSIHIHMRCQSLSSPLAPRIRRVKRVAVLTTALNTRRNSRIIPDVSNWACSSLTIRFPERPSALSSPLLHLSISSNFFFWRGKKNKMKSER